MGERAWDHHPDHRCGEGDTLPGDPLVALRELQRVDPLVQVVGLITFLGLLAIWWSLIWRARAALLQGLFLGALGLGVLGTTPIRFVVQQQPEAERMGVLGLVALAMHVAAAVVLIPHRTGDANVRAVWLFSRNDAIGNAAVVAAAVLVGWSGSP